MSLPLSPSGRLVPEALRLALQHGNSVSDGAYVALSRELRWGYVTADAKLYRIFRPLFTGMVLLRDCGA